MMQTRVKDGRYELSTKSLATSLRHRAGLVPPVGAGLSQPATHDDSRAAEVVPAPSELNSGTADFNPAVRDVKSGALDVNYAELDVTS